MVKTTTKQFPRVSELLPKGVKLHEPKGPIIWITKKHLQRIENELKQFDDMKKKMAEKGEANKKFEKVKQKIFSITKEIALLKTK